MDESYMCSVCVYIYLCEVECVCALCTPTSRGRPPRVRFCGIAYVFVEAIYPRHSILYSHSLTLFSFSHALSFTHSLGCSLTLQLFVSRREPPASPDPTNPPVLLFLFHNSFIFCFSFYILFFFLFFFILFYFFHYFYSFFSSSNHILPLLLLENFLIRLFNSRTRMQRGGCVYLFPFFFLS